MILIPVRMLVRDKWMERGRTRAIPTPAAAVFSVARKRVAPNSSRVVQDVLNLGPNFTSLSGRVVARQILAVAASRAGINPQLPSPRNAADETLPSNYRGHGMVSHARDRTSS